ncbi:hypothetical protein WEH80_33715 [Actinomycetes bacterium KLBMP 9759]
MAGAAPASGEMALLASDAGFRRLSVVREFGTLATTAVARTLPRARGRGR